MNTFRSLCTALAFCAGLTSIASAQWSSNPAANLAVSDRPGDQVQPKIKPTADGGCYISWYDNAPPGGYDVTLQRLDVRGVEMWAHNGTLVADRAVSFTVDYDVVVDGAGNAIIAYNDDGGVPGATQQISVQKIDPSGNKLWGLHGVTISSDSGFKANPHVAALTDGSCVIAYSDGTPSPGVWIMQKLDGAGVPQWTAPGITVSETGHYLAPSDIQPADNGSFIVLWIRAFSNSLSSKYLLSMKYDGNGAPLWTPTTVAPPLGPVTGVVIYMPAPGSTYTTVSGNGTYNATQGGSIQNGYFPTMIADGSGGAVYSWYENAGPRNAYLQHVLPNGTLKFQQNGVSNAFTALSPNGRIRIGASAAFDRVNTVYYVASPESSNPTQGNYSVIVQRFDTTGARTWGDTGVTLIGPDNSGPQATMGQSQILGNGVFVNWIWQNSSAADNGALYGARVHNDPMGSPLVAWNELLNAQNTQKSRLNAAVSTAGFAMVAFGNGASGSVNLLAQNVNIDGTLGNPPLRCGVADFNGDGDVGTDADIEAFFACLAGNCCAACGTADFNGDGDIGTDADIEAFFRVLAGGAC